MGTKVRSVAVRKLPEHISGEQRQAVYRDLESSINVDRPAVVLDCSMLRDLDNSAIHLLLCCLEEAMKRNGDVRLAAVRPEVRNVLEAAEVNCLFQTFADVSEAVGSFHRPQIEFMQFENPSETNQKSRMNAA